MNEETTGDEFEADLTPQTTTTRRRSNGGGRKVTQVTKREFIEDEVDEEVRKLQLPGILAQSEVEEHGVVRLRVWRKDPDEGMLGYLEDTNASEEEITQRWGGGQFRVDGLNQAGRIMAGRTFRLAGDPIFVSNGARLEYERRKGIAPAAAGQQGMSVQDVLAMTAKLDDDRRKADDERRSREASERRDHEERMRKLELDAAERARKDEREREERKNKEDREREERRSRDEAEREERRRKDVADSEARQRAHTDQMLAMVRASSEQALALVKQQAAPVDQGKSLMDAVKMITVIKEAFGGEAAAPEDGDPLSLLMKHGHEWLNGIGNAVSGTIRELKGGGVAPQVAGQPAAPQIAAVSPEGLTIPATSPLAGKLQHLAQTIAATGRNPEDELTKIVDNLTATIEGRPAPHQPGQPARPNAFVPTPESVASPVPVPAPEPPLTSANVQAVADHGATPPTPAAPPAAGKAQITVAKTTRGSARISFTQN